MPLATGVLGLSLADIDEMTPQELVEAITARYAYDQALQRQAWERTRIVSYHTIAPHLKKGTVRRPEDIFKLPGDAPKVSPEEITGFKRTKLTEAQKALIKRWNG